ncbi:MAG TPA: glycosyltransferase family 2 protein [Patescibacteria group bacterium]|nr:glycosyltransferase family 2 protein [Patescibacteria group bacterium]
MKKNKITLFVPVLNEIEGMKAIMPRVKKEWVDEILVLDGGSTDGSLEYAKSKGYRVIKQKSKGITNASLEGTRAAKYDYIISFSPDGNSVPEAIPALVKKINEGYDMVIGSRYLKGATSEDDDRITAFGNFMFTQLINICFGGKYTDTLVMFRAYKKDIVRESQIDIPRAGLEPLLSIRCAKKKLKVTEIPASEPRRIGGVRKMSPLFNGLAIFRLIFTELIH